MADATIRFNPERTAVEIDTPDGKEWGPEPWPPDQLVVLSDEDTPGDKSYVAILDGYGNLEANTVYELVKVGTLAEEDDAVELDEADEQPD